MSSNTISGWMSLTRSSIARTIASTSAAERVSMKSAVIAATTWSGPRWTVNRPLDRSTPRWAPAIAQIDVPFVARTSCHETRHDPVSY